MRKGLILLIFVVGFFSTNLSWGENPNKAVPDEPKSSEILQNEFEQDMELVQELLKEGLGEIALEELRWMATEAYPDHPEVLFLLGSTAANLSQSSEYGPEKRAALLEEAITALNSVLEYESQQESGPSVRILVELGRAFFFKSDYPTAKNLFYQALTGNPLPRIAAEVHFLAGISAVNISYHPEVDTKTRNTLLDQAIQSFEWVLKYESQENRTPSVRILVELGRTHFSKGQHHQSKDYFQRALAATPPPHIIAEIHFRTGLSAVSLAHNPEIDAKMRDTLLDEAIQAFEWVLKYESEGKNPPVRILLELGRAHFQKREFPQAKEYFQQVIALSPPPSTTAEMNFLVGISAINMSRNPQLDEEGFNALLDEAIHALEQTLEYESGRKDGSPVNILMELGRAHFFKGDAIKTKEYFQRVMESNPPPEITAEINFILGNSAFDRSQNPALNEEERNALIDEAIDAFTLVLEYESQKEEDTPPTPLLLKLGRAHFFKNDIPKANEYLRQILDTNPTGEIAAEANFMLGTGTFRMSHNPTLDKEIRHALLDEAITAFQFVLEYETQQEGSAPPVDILLKLGRIHFFKEEYPQTKEYLQQALEQDLAPALVSEANFLLGMSEFHLAQRPELEKEERNVLLDKAITFFNTILEQDNDSISSNRIQLELGRAYFLKGEGSTAKKHFQHVLDNDPPPEVAANIHPYLNTIKNNKPWHIRVNVALIYNSNISGIDDKDTILIFGLPFKWEKQGKLASGIGSFKSIDANYTLPLNDDGLEMRFKGSIVDTDYSNNLYDETIIKTQAGPAYRWRSGEVSGLGILRHRLNAGRSHYSDIGVRLSANQRIGQRLDVGAKVDRYSRLHTHTKEQDGPGGREEVSISYALNQNNRMTVKIGRNYESPKKPFKNRHTVRSKEIIWESIVMDDYTVGLSFKREEFEYKGKWAPFTLGGVSRKDEILHARLDISAKNFTLFGFTPRISLIFEERNSNAQLHNYEIIRTEIGFAYRW